MFNTNWKRIAGQRIRRLTADQARLVLESIRQRGATIEQPAIRALTGGYASQSINHYVIRKVAERAKR